MDFAERSEARRPDIDQNTPRDHEGVRRGSTYPVLKHTLSVGKDVALYILPREGIRKHSWFIEGTVVTNNEARVSVSYFGESFVNTMVIPVRYFTEGRVLHGGTHYAE